MNPAPTTRERVISATIILRYKKEGMMSESVEWEVGEDEAGSRLDVFMVKRGEESLSRSRVLFLVKGGHVQRWESGDWEEERKASHKVRPGEVYRISLERAREEEKLEGEEMHLDVVYEDAHLLVLNKPSGLVVHPGAGHRRGTLVHGLLWHCGGKLSGVGGEFRPGVVHRLDKDTTGLMVVAKEDGVHRDLSRQLELRTMGREYEAVVWGRFLHRSLRVDAPIGRDEKRREAFRVCEGGRPALSEFWGKEVLAGGAYTLVGCRLGTGRTHQIRVHLSDRGYEVVGDPVYGRRRVGKSRSLGRRSGDDFLHRCREAVLGFPRQALHARSLEFDHPVTGDRKIFGVNPPEDMQGLLRILRGE
jgi:23S rRNA pseudouridine1911/1915/1917 synthase